MNQSLERTIKDLRISEDKLFYSKISGNSSKQAKMNNMGQSMLDGRSNKQVC
jgi:hypothetical protein